MNAYDKRIMQVKRSTKATFRFTSLRFALVLLSLFVGVSMVWVFSAFYTIQTFSANWSIHSVNVSLSAPRYLSANEDEEIRGVVSNKHSNEVKSAFRLVGGAKLVEVRSERGDNTIQAGSLIKLAQVSPRLTLFAVWRDDVLGKSADLSLFGEVSDDLARKAESLEVWEIAKLPIMVGPLPYQRFLFRWVGALGVMMAVSLCLLLGAKKVIGQTGWQLHGERPVVHGRRSSGEPELDLAHVLFMDIVGYSKLPIDLQTSALHRLQEELQHTREFLSSQGSDRVITLPTGDGMALAFFGDPFAPVRCAIELSRSLRTSSEIPLRMGVGSGPIYRITDINTNPNVAGDGINMAQRVMDCGDAGHILLSKRVADDLLCVSGWEQYLHDLGEVEVKHGKRIHIFNLCSGDFGNAERPKKVTST